MFSEFISEQNRGVFFRVYFLLQIPSFSGFSSLFGFELNKEFMFEYRNKKTQQLQRHFYSMSAFCLSPLWKANSSRCFLFFLFFTPHHYHQKVAGEKLIGARHVRYDHRLFATASLSFEENWLM